MKTLAKAVSIDNQVEMGQRLLEKVGLTFGQIIEPGEFTSFIKQLLPQSHKDKSFTSIHSTTKKQEKVKKLLTQIELINNLNTQYEQLTEELNELTMPIQELLDLETDFIKELKCIPNEQSKECIRRTFEAKAKIAYAQEELRQLNEKKDFLTRSLSKTKKKYLKEYSSLKRALSNKENIDLLMEREKAKERYARALDANTTFEHAVDKFLITLYDVADSTDDTMAGNELVQVYEDGSVIEAKFDMEDVSYIVSISSSNDSIKIGEIKDMKVRMIGKGFSFDQINWSEGYGNTLIIQLFNRLKTFRKELQQPESVHLSALKLQTS